MTSPFTNPSYLLPPLVSLVICIGLVLLIYRASPKRQSSIRLFIGLLIILATWGLIVFGLRTSLDIQQALFWQRGMPVVALASFVLLYHFTRAYTHNHGQKSILIASYVVLVVTVAISPTELLIERMRVEDYGYTPVIGPAAYPLLMSCLLLAIASMRNLVKRCKISYSYEEKNRLIYLVLGAGLLITGVFLDAVANLPPIGIKTNIAFGILCSVAILKYDLLDIRTVARRSLAYVLTSSAIAIPYVSIMFYITRTLGVGASPFWIHAIIIVLISILIRPLYNWSQRIVDKVFYGSRYDYLKALEQFSRETQSITKLEELGSTMIKLVNGALRSSSACLLLMSESKNGLATVSSIGLDSPPPGIMIRNPGLLVKWLRLHGNIISSKDLSIIPELQNISQIERRNLEKLGAELLVPIKTHDGELSGLLILGEKLSQQAYSIEDKRLLSTIANQTAVSLENARLYEESRRSEEALRESEEKLRLVFDSMTDGVVVTDLNGKITQVNETMSRLYACDRNEELIGRNVFELIVEKDHARAIENLKRMQESRYTKSIEYTLLEKNGNEFAGELSATILRDKSGNPAQLVMIIRDVTERKRTEAEKRDMEKKAEIASRLASVGEMASGIAHEINNPLTGVIGYSQLLMKKDIPEDIKKNVETIYKGTQRVASIVSRLLTFARQHKTERNYIDINEIIENTLVLQAYEMDTNNIVFITQLDPKLPRTMGDAGQLQQVFLNIIINAETEMKLAHGRGKLLVKAERIDSNIRISFKDDGPGITKENLKKVFDPFFTTREVGKGTGLGLSLCHGIVSEHDGRIYVKSQLGKGATFIVELPIVVEEKQELTESADVSERVAGGKILVVDDEPTIFQFLNEVLTDEGHEVETVDNASDALEMIRSDKYDLILLDIKLPGMSGIELYEFMQKTYPSLARRVVFITGDVRGVDTKAFLTETKAKYIAKPFDAEKIKKEVSRILAKIS